MAILELMERPPLEILSNLLNKSTAALVFLAAAGALFAQPKLSVDAALHQFEDGPELAAEYQFVPGETAYFSCRIAGHQLLKKEKSQAVKLTWEIRMLDPTGIPIDKDLGGKIEDELAPQDKDWKPKFLASFIVPGFAPTGQYHVSIKVKDEIAGTEVSANLPFRVRGRSVETSETLVTRDFAFVRAEDDQVAMRDPVYHPGETLWAKFNITGYKFGENNRFSVDYGLAILDAAGKQVFAQPDAAQGSKESFYPQRFVPGQLSLTLDPNVPKAAYTLVVTARDKVGTQTFESRHAFRIE
jgi:hypothetical protein